MGSHLFILYRFVIVLLVCITCVPALALQDKPIAQKPQVVLAPVDPHTVNPFLPDSVIKANHQKFVGDSVAMSYLMPDSSRMKNRDLDSILQLGANVPFLRISAPLRRAASVSTGSLRKPRDKWLMGTVIGLLVYTALLNLFFGGELKSLLQSFYIKRSQTYTDKEAGVINTWAFVGLFLLFCLALGLILYQLAGFYGKTYAVSGFDLFISLAGLIGVLVALKFLLLKLIGFIFDITGLINEYLAVLNLTYFSLAYLLLAVALCLSLLANQYIPQLLIITLGLTVVILVWQYLRSSLNIISNFRFHKFYLFVYLCALEICPVLVLIKALNI
jgi:hypothetical protein